MSIAVELSDIFLSKTKIGKVVGLDLGINNLATLSDGTKIQIQKTLKIKLKKLQCLNKQFLRKQKGSDNRTKAKTKLSSLHYQISCIRKDFLHKLTINLIKTYDTIANKKVKILIYTWTCKQCKTSHDRDINASINIFNHATKV